MMKRRLFMLVKTGMVIPYVLLYSFDGILKAVPLEGSLPDRMWCNIWGRVNEKDMLSLPSTLNGLYCSLLFAMLFGSVISEYFGSVRTMLFTRIPGRIRFFLEKLGELCVCSFGYSFLFAAMELGIAIRQTSPQPLDGNVMRICAVLFFVTFSLNLLMGLLVNWISLRSNFLLSVVLVLFLAVALDCVSIFFYDSPLCQLVNPLCMNVVLLERPMLLLMKTGILFLYLLFVSAGMAVHVRSMDVF